VQPRRGSLTAPRVVALAPGAVETVTLPWVVDLVQLNPNCVQIGEFCIPWDAAVSTLRRGGAYHVHSDGPITAYQFNPLTFSRPNGLYSYTLEMDGVALRGSSSDVGGFTVYTLPIAPGDHRLVSPGGQGIGLKVYGVAPYTSYMYPGGLDLRRITPG
jgi:hypothetical protein